MSGDMQMEEKSRTCPSCRTSISVLATKCRFCGEAVGKPKVEIRQLSVNDLGGESVHHQAVSSNVIGALDEMRKEASGSGTSNAQDMGAGGIDISGLDDFDRPSFSTHTPKVRKVSMTDRLMTAVKIIAVLGVIALVAIKVPPMLKDAMADDPEIAPPVHVNQAPGILANDGDLLDALRAAVEAKSEAPSAENDKIVDEVMDLLNEEVDGLLNARSWNFNKLKEASALANQTADIYPSSSSNTLKSTVNQEFIDYGVMLMGIDSGGATFQMNTGKTTLKKGELVADRFKIMGIDSDTVSVQDVKRNNRKLTFEMARGPR